MPRRPPEIRALEIRPRDPFSLNVRAICPLLALLVCGCGASTHLSNFRVNDHAVFVHPDGRAMEALEPVEVTERGRHVGVRLNAQAGERQLSRLLDSVRNSPHDTILIYVHGGRVSYDKSYGRVAERGAVLDSAGYYPIFINWNSAGGSSLWWHLFRIRQGQDWGPVRGVLSSPFMLVASAGRAVSRAPLGALQQAADYCRTLGGTNRGDIDGRITASRFCPVPGVDAARAAQARYEQRLVTYEQADSVTTAALAIGIGTHDMGWTNGTLRVTTGVVTAAPKLVLGPVLDGFGSGAWVEMRRRAFTTIRSRREFRPSADGDPTYRPPSGIVHALIDSLQAMMAAQGADSVPPERRRQRSLVLAAHSMGTIVTDRVLLYFPELPVARIVYLAPATTLTELEVGVIRFLERNPGTLYYHGTLHPYADAGEWQPGFLDLVPRGSLLEWVDDHFTSPDTPFDRVSGKWTNIVTAPQIFSPAVRDRVVIKAFGVRDPVDAGDPVLWGEMHRHIGFSHPYFAFWDDRTWHLRPHRTPSGLVVAPVPPGSRQGNRVDGSSH